MSDTSHLVEQETLERFMKKYINAALLISIGINISLFALSIALGSKDLMLLSLLSTTACMVGLIYSPLPEEDEE